MHEIARTLSARRLGIYAAIIFTLPALYPQFALLAKRGHDWNGFYAYFSQDEIAYSAYVNALIENRPRRNDPYTGRDDAPKGAPQPESLFSIQFVPAYMIALPARALNLSAPTVFILLTGLIAFASVMAIYWLIRLVTNDERYAATGALVVLCLGTFAILYAPLRMLFGQDTTYTFEYFPFLRRYVPAVPFPFFFLFCALVWRSLSQPKMRAALLQAALAGLVFALLVYSYFYLWTAAAAWLGCLGVLWLIARPHSEQGLAAGWIFCVITLFAIAAFVPYFILLSARATTMDTVQLLALSHAPDFSRSSIKLGLIVCVMLGYAAWRGLINRRSRECLFTASFALTPLLVFNQQVITGRSLQPLHYELYIAKYTALVALILAIALIRRGQKMLRERDSSDVALFPARVLLCAALVALGWGLIETVVETKRHAWASLDRDEALPVSKRLASLPAVVSDSKGAQATAVVLYTNLDHADISPVVAPQPVLWSPHVPAFSGVTLEENRERIYQYLYYVGEDLAGIDAKGFEALDYRKKYLIHSLIEWGHNDPAWTVNWKEITPEDVQGALGGYADYAAAFNRERASNPLLSYVVTPTDAHTDFSNLDRWYARDEGERIGPFTLYRVKLRP
ncbi:MAG TPA: hypothetical protein VM095_08295 [Pyrinomonadaceae bacterium]|nr:hypothetical protein [Pyrinomonadaceae bacterium]